jgi:hypothetical protein
MRFHDVVGRRIVAIEQDKGTPNLRRMLLDDGSVVEFRAEKKEPGESVVLSRSRVLKKEFGALQAMLSGFEWRWATLLQTGGFGCEWFPASRDMAAGLMYAAGLDQPLPRPGKEVVLYKVDRHNDWSTVVLVNMGGKFEVRRY